MRFLQTRQGAGATHGVYSQPTWKQPIACAAQTWVVLIFVCVICVLIGKAILGSL
jgi:hypothetical protein